MLDLTISILFGVFLALIPMAVLVFCGLRYIHMLQLESYQNNMFSKWVKHHYKGLDLKLALCDIGLIVLAILLFNVFVFVDYNLINFVCMAGFYVVCAMQIYSYYSKPKKKPLVLTTRVKRLMVCFGIVIFLVYVVFGVFNPFTSITYLLMQVCLPWLLILANKIMNPIENKIKRNYMNDAKAILQKRKDLIKIGITGSYGKTSTKFILQKILSEKYNTLCSPSSFNTPMGITKVVREMLKPEHEVFIAEMGARYTHDIKDLCELVHPTYGLITSIGKQHLETFGSFENIIKTKYDLIRSLPTDGVAFMPNDSGPCLEKFYETKLEKALFSLDKYRDATVWAENISMGIEGSIFDLVTNTGKRVTCNTILLGKHNIQNILGCALVALRLGLTLEQIRVGISKIAPIEHRLQLIKSPNGIFVIDDAFNANPTGTKAALDVLACFPGRKIIVTPGLVELGKQEAQLNTALGEDIAKVATIAVLVGKSFSGYIKNGLLRAGFNKDNIVELDTLDEVTNFIGVWAKAGDVVLFENDLPDNYK